MDRLHRNKIHYNSFDYYRNFKRMCPEISISQKLHTKILKTFFSKVIQKIIHEMYRFPFAGMGHIYLTKKKVVVELDESGNLKTNAATNWKATVELRKKTQDPNKKVVFLNEHTNGYTYRVRWNKGNYFFMNREFFRFIPSRNFRVAIVTAIKNSIKPISAYADDFNRGNII